MVLTSTSCVWLDECTEDEYGRRCPTYPSAIFLLVYSQSPLVRIDAAPEPVLRATAETARLFLEDSETIERLADWSIPTAWVDWTWQLQLL